MMAHTPAARGARRPGPDHGRRRLPVRVRRRLGRRPDPRRGRGAGGGARRRARRRRAGRLPRAREPRARRRQLVLAVRAGAVQIDGSTRRFGAGAGNTPCEALVAVCDRLGIRTGIDVLRSSSTPPRTCVRPVMDGECVLDRMALVMGYAGVYSSFLKHAYRAAERYGVSGAEILLECGRTQAGRRPGGPAHRDRGGACR